MKYRIIKFAGDYPRNFTGVVPDLECPQCEIPYYLMNGPQRPYRDTGICKKCSKRIEKKKVNSSYPW